MTIRSKYGSCYPVSAALGQTRAVAKGKGARRLAAHHPSAHQGAEGVVPIEEAPRDTVQQAFKDVTRGLPDTDRAAEMDRTYQKQKK